MDIAIFLFLHKEGMGFEIEFIRMLEDEVCTRVENVFCEDLVRNIGQTVNRIWRIGEYQVELLMTDLKELEDIMADDSQIIHSELRRLRLDEIRMKGKYFDTIYT